MYTDKTIVCKECRQEFTFTASEQERYEAKGFNEPKRCLSCRMARKNAEGSEGSGENSERVSHPAVCAECGKDFLLPFVPRGTRPVYCFDCLRKKD